MTITIAEEEALLLNKLVWARNAVKVAENNFKKAKAEKEKEESELEDAQENISSYMRGNGVKTLSVDKLSITISDTESVQVKDINEVPLKFIREKHSKEVDKALIHALKPLGNWYTIVTGDKLTIKGKS